MKEKVQIKIIKQNIFQKGKIKVIIFPKWIL